MPTKCPGTGNPHTVQPRPTNDKKNEGTKVAEKKTHDRAPVRRFK